MRDHSRLITAIGREFEERFPRSASLHREACRHLVDGGSHAMRLTRPFPPRIVSASGGHVRDEDGHHILDFWQGHMANLLGHNPATVSSGLARAFRDGFGLQLGMPDRLQAEVAEILCARTGADRVRFTTSGTLANMYGVILACAFTGRTLVTKVGGGWHGAHPWSLKGTTFHAEDGIGFAGVESEGLPAAVTDAVITTPFNDPERLREMFTRRGDRIACFVVEPVLGAGGLVPATREYLELARQLTRQYGALLIFDEVVTGFRFRAGDLGTLYGVEADLAVFGKAMGGGMPVAALAGRAEVMDLIGRAGGRRVAVQGGSYSGHPCAMMAAKSAMGYLVEHENEVYSSLSVLGQKMRDAMVRGFCDEGIFAVSTGMSPELPCGSSLAMVHFPHNDGATVDTPETVHDPAVCDVVLRNQVLPPALLLENVNLVNGHGAAATTHTDSDMEHLRQACRNVARRVKSHSVKVHS